MLCARRVKQSKSLGGLLKEHLVFQPFLLMKLFYFLPIHRAIEQHEQFLSVFNYELNFIL